MINPLIQALIFLINTIFGIYILLLMLRFLLTLMQVGFRGNKLLQLLLKLTDPPLQLLYTFVPGWKNVDIAAIVLMLLLKMLEWVLVTWLWGKSISLWGLFILSTANILSLLIYIFIFSILIQVILDWVTPHDSYNPIGNILYYLNEPLLQPARNWAKPLQNYGIDFSPFIVTICLYLADIILVGFLLQLA
ncbi:YggT family protein [Thiotrichales bacterium HSG1]|nr:YggT family protein [Thiotrichales bacterium HSG1]